MTFGGDLSTLDPNVTLMNGTGPRTDNFLSLPSPEDAAVLLDLGLSPSPELLPQPIVHAMEVHEQLNYAPEYKKKQFTFIQHQKLIEMNHLSTVSLALLRVCT